MKPQNILVKVALLMTMGALFVGCSSGSSDSGGGSLGTSGGVPVTPGGTTPPPSPVSVALTIDSDAAISTYSLGGINSISQVSGGQMQVSVSLSNFNPSADGGMYGGTVSLQYYDVYGGYHPGLFTALNATTPGSVWDGSNKYVKNLNHAAYNRWFTYNGQNVFHGFYADPYGAIMLVITGGLNLGDGNGSSSLSGEIWFKNYATNAVAYNYPNPNNTPCWFLSLGQYECRTFLVNGDSGYGLVNTTSALTPNQSLYTENKNPYVPATPARGWQRLGTFTGLSGNSFGQ